MTNEYTIMVQMLPTESNDCGEDQFFTLEMLSDLDFRSFMDKLQTMLQPLEEKLRLVIEYLNDEPSVHRHILEMIGAWDE